MGDNKYVFIVKDKFKDIVFKTTSKEDMIGWYDFLYYKKVFSHNRGNKDQKFLNLSQLIWWKTCQINQRQNGCLSKQVYRTQIAIQSYSFGWNW